MAILPRVVSVRDMCTSFRRKRKHAQDYANGCLILNSMDLKRPESVKVQPDIDTLTKRGTDTISAPLVFNTDCYRFILLAALGCSFLPRGQLQAVSLSPVGAFQLIGEEYGNNAEKDEHEN